MHPSWYEEFRKFLGQRDLIGACDYLWRIVDSEGLSEEDRCDAIGTVASLEHAIPLAYQETLGRSRVLHHCEREAAAGRLLMELCPEDYSGPRHVLSAALRTGDIGKVRAAVEEVRADVEPVPPPGECKDLRWLRYNYLATASMALLVLGEKELAECFLLKIPKEAGFNTPYTFSVLEPFGVEPTPAIINYCI